MIALFENFIPSYCPNCGARLFHPAGADGLEALRGTLDDYHAGEPFTCAGCGLRFRKVDQAELRSQADRMTSDPGELLACADCGDRHPRETMHPAGGGRYLCDTCAAGPGGAGV